MGWRGATGEKFNLWFNHAKAVWRSASHRSPKQEALAPLRFKNARSFNRSHSARDGFASVRGRSLKMKKYSKTSHHSLSELNITPLLDLAFVLLVIFIITTAPTVSDISINLPSAQSVPKDAPPKINYVSVDNAGKIYFNQKEVSSAELLAFLVDFRKADPDLNVVVRGDSAVQYKKNR